MTWHIYRCLSPGWYGGSAPAAALSESVTRRDAALSRAHVCCRILCPPACDLSPRGLSAAREPRLTILEPSAESRSRRGGERFRGPAACSITDLETGTVHPSSVLRAAPGWLPFLSDCRPARLRGRGAWGLRGGGCGSDGLAARQLSSAGAPHETGASLGSARMIQAGRTGCEAPHRGGRGRGLCRDRCSAKAPKCSSLAVVSVNSCDRFVLHLILSCYYAVHFHEVAVA